MKRTVSATLPSIGKLSPHYVMDANGETVAVQLSPKEYKQVERMVTTLREMRKDLNQIKRAMAIYHGVKSAIHEVHEVEAGKRPVRLVQDVLSELPG